MIKVHIVSTYLYDTITLRNVLNIFLVLKSNMPPPKTTFTSTKPWNKQQSSPTQMKALENTKLLSNQNVHLD